MQPDTPTPPSQNPMPAPSPVLPPPSPNKDKHRGETVKSVFGTLLILLIAPILALAITAFIFQSYEVEGPSMEPTLQTQNRLIIWKAGRTWARVTKSDFIPKRGNIVVFIKHGMYDFNSDKEKQLIKRVIGLPGERVVVKDGSITVYNDQNPGGFNPDKTMEYGDNIKEITDGNVDITLGPSEIFVSGDNRKNSLDSRSFGAVPVKDLVGTLSLRILPLSEVERF